MKYIYTLPNCRKSRELKRKYHLQSIVFEERPLARITLHDAELDAIDQKAVRVYEKTFQTPVEVEYNDQ